MCERIWTLPFSALDLDEVGHDEVRLPLFAQILGFGLADTGFYPRWMDPEIERVFNADSSEVDPALVASELAREAGRRVFHPCRERFDAAGIEELLTVRPAPPIPIDRLRLGGDRLTVPP